MKHNPMTHTRITPRSSSAMRTQDGNQVALPLLPATGVQFMFYAGEQKKSAHQ